MSQEFFKNIGFGQPFENALLSFVGERLFRGFHAVDEPTSQFWIVDVPDFEPDAAAVDFAQKLEAVAQEDRSRSRGKGRRKLPIQVGFGKIDAGEFQFGSWSMVHSQWTELGCRKAVVAVILDQSADLQQECSVARARLMPASRRAVQALRRRYKTKKGRREILPSSRSLFQPRASVLPVPSHQCCLPVIVTAAMQIVMARHIVVVIAVRDKSTGMVIVVRRVVPHRAAT